MKHAVLLALLERLTAIGGPLTVLDTHAGAGLYDLEGESARRSGEAAAGVVRLMQDEAAPAVFAPLKALVRAENASGGLRRYPGSPLVALSGLRAGDRYIGCELRPEEQRALGRLICARSGDVAVKAVAGDGYEALVGGRAGGGRRLVLIDPPFERPDDYQRAAEAIAVDAGRGGEAVHAVWTPLKDLQTFDAFLGRMEAIGVGGLAVEARLRPLTDPLRLNGCAVVVAGPPPVIEAIRDPAAAAAEWIAERLGEAGAAARLEPLVC